VGGTKALAAAVVALAGLVACRAAPAERPLRVGSKNFTEQVVLGEIVAQHLERRLNRAVERRLNLGGTLLAHQALLSGEIDLYPEYTGTALTAILNLPAGDNDPASTLTRVRDEYRKRFQVDWRDPLGINNGIAMVVTGAAARERKVQTLSQAAAVGGGWLLGAGYEFEQRPDGLAALDRVYQIRWSGPPRSMDLGLLYRALQQGQVTMIAANATDGLLTGADLTVLADDRRAFPPYEVCLAVREETVRANPPLAAALEELSGRLSNETMQRLNHEADVEHRPVGEIAAAFLKGIER
jgi:osmoprotectant transport system substrate-binding protein